MSLMTAGAAAWRHEGGGLVQTVLSSVNKAADIALSNGNRDAESFTGVMGGVVLSVSGKESGKYYAEVTLVQVGLSSQLAVAFGLNRGTSSLSDYAGANANSWGSWEDGVGGFQRSTYHNGLRANIATGQPAPAPGMRGRLAVDLDAGALWLSHFDSATWVGGGDPATGTNPTYSWTPDLATYYLALCPRFGHASQPSNRNRLRLELPSDWAFSPPVGFGVWT